MAKQGNVFKRLNCMTHGIYTLCNDRMMPFARSFYKSLLAHCPHIKLVVIPFDENISELQQFCLEKNVTLIDPSPVWDEIGQRIYGDFEYRPGIPAWRYYRKLNAFNVDLFDQFTFHDVNSLILGNPQGYVQKFIDSGKDICFMARSAKGRTLRHESFQAIANVLNPSIRTGFSAGFMISKKNIISSDVALAISKNPRIRKLFGKSPEQAFISWYVALTGVNCGMFHELSSNFQKGFWIDKFKIVKSGNSFEYSEGPSKGGKIFCVKAVGQDVINDKSSKNGHLFSEFYET